MTYPYNYIDCSMVSEYYPIFCRLGYPQLDLVKYEDGEWAIIEYLNAPLIPSMTKYHHVLKNIRHLEINESNISDWIKKLSPSAIIEREEKKTIEMELEKERLESHRETLVDETIKVISKNDDLKERIAKNGMGELALPTLAKQLTPSQLKRA